MFTFATILCVVIACLPQPWSTRRYFLAVAISIPGALWFYRHYGADSRQYTYAYLFFEGLVVLQCFLLAFQATNGILHRLRAFAIPIPIVLVLGKIAWMDAHRVMDFNDWLNVLRGTFLLWLGTVLGLSAGNLRLRGPCTVLGLLWLAQGMFSLGHVTHLGWDSWHWADWYFQGLVAVVAWTLVGCGLIRAHFSSHRSLLVLHGKHCGVHDECRHRIYDTFSRNMYDHF